MSTKPKSCSLDPIPTSILFRIHGRLVAIHHLHVQQVIARGPAAAVPAACIGYSDPQERRP